MRTTALTTSIGSLAACVLLAALCGSGCRHDLDALKEGTSSGPGTSGSGAGDDGTAGTTAGAAGEDGGAGSSGTTAGVSGTAGDGGTAGTDGTAGTGMDECKCEAPASVKIGAVKVAPTACCYGVRNDRCGVAFEKSDTCFATSTKGNPDADCAAANGNPDFAGCCRLDGQCGVQIDTFKLGCVAFSDIPKAFGGSQPFESCVPACNGDSDCATLEKNLACVETLAHSATSRSCAQKCLSDKDCMDNPRGSKCLLLKNKVEGNFDQFCGEEVGPVADGDACSLTTGKGNEDCVHGICIPNSGSTTEGTCSRLCKADCDAGYACRQISAATAGNTFSLDVCLKL